jgi:beta-galactosidase
MGAKKISKEIIFILPLCITSCLWLNAARSSYTINLNGPWEMGYSRNYTEKVIVPGIHTDATKMAPATLWYRKEVTMPRGNWKYATLELKGARFSPEVYINGVSVSKQNGGMAPTVHLLKHKDVRPGRKVIIEITLTSLKDLSPADASYIPVADQWRSNISSSLWNDIVLKLHGDLRIDRIIPFIDFDNQKVDFSLFISNPGSSKTRNIRTLVEILDNEGRVLVKNGANVILPTGKITIAYGTVLKPWSPVHPNMYRARFSLIESRDTIDQSVIPFGVKDFRINDKQFFLNREHITLLGGTVVWHRWVRDKEARMLAYDTAWFTQNVILRSKEHGANYLRFHLGVPPEIFLNLCDKYGLAVQYEWSFFHGMPATKESLLEQYTKWFDLAMKHPSVVLYHPYNETEGDQLKIVWDALNTILADYPPLVLEDRDVIHVHKYWWSLFENLGLYYDSANQFPKTIMVDEFGGDYLDGDGMMGGYSTESETFLRFLGRNHTKESRLALQNMANGRVAEYWRRIGAAGVSPFCILGSWNDGCHWFLGNLAEGNPKPVWNWLTCAWSPQSVSIDLWDRNFVSGQMLSVPLYLFNDTRNKNKFNINLSLKDKNGKIFIDRSLTYEEVPAFSTLVKYNDLILPSKPGKYIIRAELLNRPETVKYPVISQWEINVFKPQEPEVLLRTGFSVAAEEPEIIQFLKDHNIQNVSFSDPSSKILILSKQGWEKIANGDKSLVARIEQAINSGTSVILLDAGDRFLGQGYPLNKNDLGPLQGVAVKSNTPVKTYNLFGGIRLSFSEAAEPESHIHADKNNSFLWNLIPQDHTWLWNGMRGGLIVPATSFEFEGMSSSAFLAQWLPRGADEKKIKSENYFAYSLEGFYEFSGSPSDNEAKAKLKKKVTFLVEDAPALANSLNPSAPVNITDLSKEYRESRNGMGESLTPLVNAGKNLTRTPVIMIGFGKGKGKLIVSQLLTAGRLSSGFGEEGQYGIRYDPVANQLVLNMMELALNIN